MKEIICKDGVYLCPVCKSKKVVEVCECLVFRYFNLNTKKAVNPVTGNVHMSNRDKAFSYDKAKRVWVHYFECYNCHWTNADAEE